MSSKPHSHLTGIASFVSTVEHGNFTSAAERLRMSKSAVAKNVARLEERLGTRLLDRTTRRIGLTVDGRAYHEACVRVLAELEDAERVLASRQRLVTGVLRVTLPASFGPRWLVPMLLDITKSYPELSLSASFSDRYVDLIEDGIDLAVRIGELTDSTSLVARKIGVQECLVCASPGYVAKRGRPTSLGDIAAHDCIGWERGGRILPWFLQTPAGDVVKVPIKPRSIVSHGEGMLSAAVAGGGLAFLPTWLASDAIRAGKLEWMLSTDAVLDRPIHLVWPKARDLLPKVRVVVDELVRRFQKKAPWSIALDDVAPPAY